MSNEDLGMYALDGKRGPRRTDGVAPGDGDDTTAPFWARHPGLLPKAFLSAPASPGSKYSDRIYYLPTIPELRKDDAGDRRVIPPVIDESNHEYLTDAYVIDVGKTPKFVDAELPWDLRHVPVSRRSVDNTIEDTVVPNRYNSKPDGEIKWTTKYYMLVLRGGEGYDPEPSVLMLGAQQAQELCQQLAVHRKYVDNLVGVPLSIYSTNGAVSVDPVTTADRIEDMKSALDPVNEEGDIKLHKYLFTVREQYERFLLDHGWESTVEKETGGGLILLGGWTHPKLQVQDSGQVPWETEPVTNVTQILDDAEVFDEHSTAELREMAVKAGIEEIGPRTSRKKLIELIKQAG